MVNQTVTNMGRPGRPKKIVNRSSEIATSATADVEAKLEDIVDQIPFLSVDFGREDINDIARKINEIITKLNG